MHEHERVVLVAAGWIEPFAHEPHELIFRQGAHLLQREVALRILGLAVEHDLREGQPVDPGALDVGNLMHLGNRDQRPAEL